MAKLTTSEKQVLEKLFQMEGGYVLNFSNRTFQEFFRDDLGVDIYNKKFDYESGSKANRLRAFWLKEDDKVVGKSVVKLIEYINTQIILGNLGKKDFPEGRINAGVQVAQKLLEQKIETKEIATQATFTNGNIKIYLQQDVFGHVRNLLKDGYYFNAVEEAYKIARKRLKTITGKEKATEAFNRQNYKKIFGHEPKDEVERDFFEGVKFLHMAIQFLRNEKAHTPARRIDKNLAIHYIALASLAYDLINRK